MRTMIALCTALGLLVGGAAYAEETPVCEYGSFQELIDTNAALNVPVRVMEGEELEAFGSDPDTVAVAGEKPAEIVKIALVGYTGGGVVGDTFKAHFFDAAGCALFGRNGNVWNYTFIKNGEDGVVTPVETPVSD